MGLGMYGRSFTLQNAGNNGLGAPASGAGTAATYTGESGYIAYFEVSFTSRIMQI